MQVKAEMCDPDGAPTGQQIKRIQPQRLDVLGKLLLTYGLISATLVVETPVALPLGKCVASPLPGVTFEPGLELDRQYFLQRVLMPMLWCMGVASVTVSLSKYELDSYVDLFHFVQTGRKQEARFGQVPGTGSDTRPIDPHDPLAGLDPAGT